MDKVIYLIYPAVLIYLLAGAKLYKRGSWNDGFMSLEQTKLLQGFAAVIVMCHHLSQKVSAHWIDRRYYQQGMEGFVEVGYLCVSIFFFCSGYGLYKSYKSKDNYLKGFAKKRILPIILAFYVSEVIYLIPRILLGEKMNPLKILAYLTGIRQSNPNAWYSIILPLFYLFFYVMFKRCKSDSSAILGTTALVFVYMILATFVNHNDYLLRGEWWFNSVHLFPIGLIFAKHEEKIVGHIKKYYWIYLPLSFILSIVLYYAALYATFTVSYYYEEFGTVFAGWNTVSHRWICLVVQMLATMMVVFFFIIFRMKVKIGNPALRFVGNNTLEFYLIHGLFVHLFSFSFEDMGPSLYYIKYPPLFVLVVTVLSILGTILFRKLLVVLRIKK